MAVGDYIHAKEAGTAERTHQHQRLPRQLLAQQARVPVPSPKLPGFAAIRTSRSTSIESRGPSAPNGIQQPEHQVAQNGDDPHRDPFDTDVEGVDDSTIAGTSVMGAEDTHVAPPLYSNGYRFQRPLVNPSYNHAKPEGLANKSVKASGFDTDEAEVDSSHAGSSVQEDDDDDDDDDADDADGEETQKVHWDQRQNYRPPESSMKRVEDFWLASSRRAFSKAPNPLAGDSSSAHVTVSDAVKINRPPYTNGLRAEALPRSVAVTPKGRFSPPKQPAYARYLLSPTRRASGPRPPPPRPASAADLNSKDGSEPELRSSGHERRHSARSPGVFDATNLESLDDDTMDTHSSSESSSPASVIHAKEPTTSSKKRQFELDYPPEVLHQKPFEDLESESFDYIPASNPPAPPPTSPPPQPQEARTAAERVALLIKLSDSDRRNYLSSLTMDDWEECGDELISRFSNILVKMKEARQARRKTAAAFEAEIKRRHDVVRNEEKDLATKLAEMKEGGLGVLRRQSPQSP
ncbi:hypothetical protein Plec18167_001225 [Paecilomyces lecythidis]|uniref:Extracellular mutant protein 11 C-terminal domain-containing protein n=1 Tax=Paecilomyces lecythidis TaxID=3004212 RepID=A0ABR3YBP0_9EURO